MKHFLRIVVLSFTLISTGFARFEGSLVSRDGRFTVGTLPGSETLAIFDREGASVLRFNDEESTRGTNVFWSPDSQRLLIINQWKWDFRLDAAELVDGEWKVIPSDDVYKKIDERAEAVLRIKLRQGSWSNFGSYFEGAKWLSNVIIECTASNTYGLGNGPKDPEAETREVRFSAKVTFGPSFLLADCSVLPSGSEVSGSEQDPVESVLRRRIGIEADTRYAPADARLNAVYTALRSRISRSRKEELKQLELRFLTQRERLKGNPDEYFEFTERQIVMLQQMLAEIADQ